MGDLVQREYHQNYDKIEVVPGAHKSCHISEMVEDRTKVTIRTNRGSCHISEMVEDRTKVTIRTNRGIRAFDSHRNQ